MILRLKKYKKRFSLFIVTSFICLNAAFAAAQITVEPNPKVLIRTKIKPNKVWKAKKKIENESSIPAEKSIAVDANVNVSLCVETGNLKINGWERNEVRALVTQGSQVGFKVSQKNKQSNKPEWIWVLGFDPSKITESGADECLSGGEIEIDVPRNATINVKSRESETTIGSIGKVTVENVGGDIFLNHIARGIEATTHQGDVMVGNSSGAMTLQSTTGNIVVFDASPSEIGDIFKAKTNNGAIILKDIEQRQMDVGSNSGSISFTGEFADGGQYNFNTLNGSITLSIPQNSSSKISASYGYGAFNSEIPLQNLVKSPASKTQNLTGQIGKGDATLNLTTYSGALLIKKQ
ncbi:MAG: DUF4097 domain-containing protein [Acidobacteria bacterium]|nr:DUF4097 domain-containing protein [Acidobacteriota bacterium]MCA1639320.1 DUF4097 domain-containing protein [Acidobacteriota bacterium]